jgi:hypothetical protein
MAIPHQENLPLAGSGGPIIPEAERIGQAEPAERIPFTILLLQHPGIPRLPIPKYLRQPDFRRAIAAGAELTGAEHASCKSCSAEDSIRRQNNHSTERRTHHGHSDWL